MSKNNLSIQDKGIIARTYNSRFLAESAEAPTIQRLEEGISQLMDEAQKMYQDNCYKPGTAEIDDGYIARLSTNEFFFYTKEPLTLKEFEELQNKIAEKAKKLSPGVQLILASFGVKTDAGEVMNVTPHISCGTSPDFHFLVKNNTSSIDPRYKIPDEKGSTNTLPILNKHTATSPLPEIMVNGGVKQFTFSNIIPCKTPGGLPFITAIDVCVDHRHGVAKENYKAFIKNNPGILRQPVSHVVSSSSIQIQKEHCIGSKIMHIDPFYSYIMWKNRVIEQSDSSQKNAFDSPCLRQFDIPRQLITELVQVQNNYAYKTSERDHKAYTTTLDKIKFKQSQDTNEFQEFKTKYQAYRGDFLKSHILDDLKKRIEKTVSLKELDELKKELDTSFECDVLKNGQGWFTQTFRIKTSSQKALEEMIKQQEKNLSDLGLKY